MPPRLGAHHHDLDTWLDNDNSFSGDYWRGRARHDYFCSGQHHHRSGGR
jgi:hypothetical protein